MKRILLTNFHPQQGGGGGHARYIRTILKSELRKDFEFGVAAPGRLGRVGNWPAIDAPTFACYFPGHFTRDPADVGAVRRFERDHAAEWRPDLVHSNGSRDQNIVVCGRRAPTTRALRAHAPRGAQHPGQRVQPLGLPQGHSGHLYVGHSASNISWAEPRSGCRTRGSSRTASMSISGTAAQGPGVPLRVRRRAHGLCLRLPRRHGRHKRTDLFLRGAAL